MFFFIPLFFLPKCNNIIVVKHSPSPKIVLVFSIFNINQPKYPALNSIPLYLGSFLHPFNREIEQQRNVKAISTLNIKWKIKFTSFQNNSSCKKQGNERKAQAHLSYNLSQN